MTGAASSPAAPAQAAPAWLPAVPAEPAAAPAADRPSWLPAGAELPVHRTSQPAAHAAAPQPALGPPAYGGPAQPARPSAGLVDNLMFSRLPAMGGVAVFLIAAVVIGALAVSKVRTSQLDAPVLVASDVKLSYQVGVVERWHVHESDHGVLTIPNGQKLDSRGDSDATEALRIISIAPDGTATIGFKFEALSGYSDGDPIFFNPQKAKEINLVIRPDGSIVSGGTNGTSGGKPTESAPGNDQTWSIMPDHDVKQGDSWSKSFDRPNPLGSGTLHYATNSTFERYDDLFGVKAAVIHTTYSMPIDVVLDLHALLALYGDDGAQFPAGAAVVYKGNSSGDLISSVDIGKHEVVKALVTDDADFQMTFTGLPDTPAFAPLKGNWHYGGRLTGDAEKLN